MNRILASLAGLWFAFLVAYGLYLDSGRSNREASLSAGQVVAVLIARLHCSKPVWYMILVSAMTLLLVLYTNWSYVACSRLTLRVLSLRSNHSSPVLVNSQFPLNGDNADMLPTNTAFWTLDALTASDSLPTLPRTTFVDAICIRMDAPCARCSTRMSFALDSDLPVNGAIAGDAGTPETCGRLRAVRSTVARFNAKVPCGFLSGHAKFVMSDPGSRISCFSQPYKTETRNIVILLLWCCTCTA